MRLLFCSVFVCGVLAGCPVTARAEAPSVASGEDLTLTVDPDLDPSAALADVERRSASATALYVSSTVLLVTSLGGVVGGGVLTLGGGASVVGVAGLFILGGAGLVFIGHVVTMVVAVCLDVGSGERRRRLEEAHPELAVRITGGPGDVGLGVALDW